MLKYSYDTVNESESQKAEKQLQYVYEGNITITSSF